MSNRIKIGKQTELSTASYSIVRTSVTGEQEYLAPGTVGQVLSIDGAGIPQWTDASITSNVDTTSVARTILITDSVQLVQTTTAGGPLTITLPSGAASGQSFTVIDSEGSGGANLITVATAGAELINDSATYVMLTSRQATTFIFDGTNYYAQ